MVFLALPSSLSTPLGSILLQDAVPTLKLVSSTRDSKAPRIHKPKNAVFLEYINHDRIAISLLFLKWSLKIRSVIVTLRKGAHILRGSRSFVDLIGQNQLCWWLEYLQSQMQPNPPTSKKPIREHNATRKATLHPCLSVTDCYCIRVCRSLYRYSPKYIATWFSANLIIYNSTINNQHITRHWKVCRYNYKFLGKDQKNSESDNKCIPKSLTIMIRHRDEAHAWPRTQR